MRSVKHVYPVCVHFACTFLGIHVF